MAQFPCKRSRKCSLPCWCPPIMAANENAVWNIWNCPCCECRMARLPQSSGKTCHLKTNETACYQKLYATEDSLSFNRLPENTVRICCLQYPKTENDSLARMSPGNDTIDTPSQMMDHSPQRLHSITCTCAPSVDPLVLPYGLPPETYDVRKRKDWLGVFVDEVFRYRYF